MERLLNAAAELDYPPHLLHIQVLDDSTDETTALAHDLVAKHRARGVPMELLHREDRKGFKAGALEAGLLASTGELVAVFDADFIPPANFLKRTVPYFSAPDVGMVQARWGHLNRNRSLLTRVQAMLLDGHFLVEHRVRHKSGCFFNFNGTAGVWRRAAIDDAGGWEHDTLTEDLDLSYRSQLEGWRFLFLPDTEVPAELPEDIYAFKSQQRRWSRGSVQTGRKLLWRVLSAPIPWRAKVEAFVHLTSNLCYPLMVLLSILLFPAMLIRRGSPSWHLLAIDLPLFTAATLSVVAFYVAAQMTQGKSAWRSLLLLPPLMGTGIGLSLNNGGAVLSGLLRKGGVFHRTPKAGQASGQGRYRLPSHSSTHLEGLAALYFLAATVYAVATGMWLCVPFLLLFLHGYTYIFALSMIPLMSRKRGL